MKFDFQKIYSGIVSRWQYCAHGVWSDTSRTFKVNIIKTLNITIKSFFNTELQTRASALTYSTLLAIVPLLALLFAIGRGFGLQNLLQDELYKILPGQHQFIDYALSFVDSYLNQASEGVFVGVGLVFLLWTLISLISSVEDSFNAIWGVKQGRSFTRKITDYTAAFLILPVLMICSSGFSIFLNNTIRSIFNMEFLSPLISFAFESASFVFTCLFFTATFVLIPNVRVKFTNALIAGVFTGVGFVILQWIFITGQMYVARYNAIYGSIAFLPLLLIWLQLVWVIVLTGSLLCYASQNIFRYSFDDQVNHISRSYYEKVNLAIVWIAAERFRDSKPPVTDEELIREYGIPARLVNEITEKMCSIGIFSRVVIDDKQPLYGYQPAVDLSSLTVNYLMDKINNAGNHDFIPEFNKNFPALVAVIDNLNAAINTSAGNTPIANLSNNYKEKK